MYLLNASNFRQLTRPKRKEGIRWPHQAFSQFQLNWRNSNLIKN